MMEVMKMYCRFCNSLIPDNTTVCPNCGNNNRANHISVCPYCGSPDGYKVVKKLKFKLIDWLIVIAFFPLGFIYLIAVAQFRIEETEKCAHCSHKKE